MSRPQVHITWYKGKSYQYMWDKQTLLHQTLVNYKLERRLQPGLTPPIHYFLLCEHAPVYTIGKSGDISHLLLPHVTMNDHGIEFFKINRGGDITYHGPGQITGYPIFDLEYFFTDLHRYVRTLEEGVIQVLRDFDLDAIRIDGFTGVWLPPRHPADTFRKICAIGVHMSRWVSMHGFAFNINTDLRYFEHIIPCGINDKSKTVTSLSKEIGYDVPIEDVGKLLMSKYAKLFDFEYIYT